MDSGIANRLGQNAGSPARHSTLRVGGIDYLNALPLTEYLSLEGSPDGSPGIELRNLVPSALARGLRAGDLDVALVPVVEYLELDDYRIIPDICVSSYGRVESIRLYHRRPLDKVRRVGLDTSSRTSALLTRLFFRTRWRGAPEAMSIDPSSALAYLTSQESATARSGLAGDTTAPDDLDAVLLIGDAALRRDAPPGWRFVDLGNEWTRFTGLPFVYAFWVCRGGTLRGRAQPPGLVDRFRAARDLGLSHIDDIVRRYVSAGGGAGAEDRVRDAARDGTTTWREEFRWREYLSRVIQYELGPAQLEGLELFFSLLGREGLHDRAPRPLEFVDESF